MPRSSAAASRRRGRKFVMGSFGIFLTIWVNLYCITSDFSEWRECVCSVPACFFLSLFPNELQAEDRRSGQPVPLFFLSMKNPLDALDFACPHCSRWLWRQYEWNNCQNSTRGSWRSKNPMSWVNKDQRTPNCKTNKNSAGRVYRVSSHCRVSSPSCALLVFCSEHNLIGL